MERDMDGADGRTYGYGRVSPRLSPSPYSPLHAPSQLPGSTPTPASPLARRQATRRSRWLRVVVVGVVVVLAGVAVGAFHLSGRVAAPVASRPQTAAPIAHPDDEAQRLSRSAIAGSRAARPRS
jgi:hypothetical protein